MISGDRIKRSSQNVLVQTVTTAVVVLPALGALYAAADAMGMHLPRVEWQAQAVARLDAVEDRVHRNIWIVGNSVLERLEQELDLTQHAIDDFKRRGERVPDHVLFRKTILELELEELKRAVDDSRKASED